MPKKFGVQTNPCIFVYILQTFYIKRSFVYYVIKEGEGVLENAYSWGSKKGGSKKDKYVIT